jgi:hypothetical protein
MILQCCLTCEHHEIALADGKQTSYCTLLQAVRHRRRPFPGAGHERLEFLSLSRVCQQASEYDVSHTFREHLLSSRAHG